MAILEIPTDEIKDKLINSSDKDYWRMFLRLSLSICLVIFFVLVSIMVGVLLPLKLLNG